jgi:type I restriction enzyme M protein
VWLVTNRKTAQRQGKVQLIDARDMWVKMRRSLGEKRREISPEQIDEITRLHGAFAEGERVKVLDNEAFGYRTITIEQPLRARWVIGPNTWQGIADEKGMTKLEPESDPAAVFAVLTQMPHRTFVSEEAVSNAIKDALLTTIKRVPAPLLKALVAGTLVSMDAVGWPSASAGVAG